MSPQHSNSSTTDSAGSILPRWVERFLRVRLVWKLVCANGLVLWSSLLIWGAISTGVIALTDQGTMLVLGLLLLGSAVVNAILVVVALGPVSDLKRTAEQVRAGDWNARTAPSPIADSGTDRLRILFNEILDDVAAQRRSALLGSQAVQREEARERGRISDEMYSDTAQDLATILIQLQVLERTAAQGRDTADSREQLGHAVRTVLENVRAVARSLRPPELDELGMEKAVEAHIRNLKESDPSLPPIRLLGEFPDDSVPTESRDVVFRVLQEALANATRHADANEIQVVFWSDEREIVAQVIDDGCGFSVINAPSRGRKGFGLPAMAERARSIAGSFRVDSTPGVGTTVTLGLPQRHSERTVQPSHEWAPVATDRQHALNH